MNHYRLHDILDRCLFGLESLMIQCDDVITLQERKKIQQCLDTILDLEHRLFKEKNND